MLSPSGSRISALTVLSATIRPDGARVRDQNSGPINPDHVSPADRLGRERVKHVEKLELIIEL